MKRMILSALAVVSSAVGLAAVMPSAEVENLSFNGEKGLLRIDYALTGGPAVVTCDILTNGVSIGRRHISSVAGDVNRLVSSASGVIYWKARGENGAVKAAAAELSARVIAHRKGFAPDYMVVDLKNPNSRFYYMSVDELPFGIGHLRYRMDFMVFRRIPASGASFIMGRKASSLSDREAFPDEVAHAVSFTDDYYLSVFELTHGQYRSVKALPDRPSGYELDYAHAYMYGGYEGDMRGWRSSSFRWPQDGYEVSSAMFLHALRLRTGLTIDFPTEAQWEFAARAGSPSALPDALAQNPGADGVCPDTGKYAWYSGNAGSVQRVGLKEPNAFGLYDMLGNVRETCLDVWSADNTRFGEIEPPGPETSQRTKFVVRGGGWKSAAVQCRNAFREGVDFSSSQQPDIGFRLWCRVPNE